MDLAIKLPSSQVHQVKIIKFVFSKCFSKDVRLLNRVAYPFKTFSSYNSSVAQCGCLSAVNNCNTTKM